jgi:hypothetical protein
MMSSIRRRNDPKSRPSLQQRIDALRAVGTRVGVGSYVSALSFHSQLRGYERDRSHMAG